jgi:hypothetical protein
LIFYFVRKISCKIAGSLAQWFLRGKFDPTPFSQICDYLSFEEGPVEEGPGSFNYLKKKKP